MSDPQPQPPPSEVYRWQTAIGVAALGTLAAVGLIVLFTYLVGWVGDFWSQVVYFVAGFWGNVAPGFCRRAQGGGGPGPVTPGGPPGTPGRLAGPVVGPQGLGGGW